MRLRVGLVSPDYSRNNANMMQSLWSKGVATSDYLTQNTAQNRS